MKLEQQMYKKIPRVGKERIYTIGNLENLSATALYYGEGGGSSGFSGGIGGGGFGGISKKECNKYGIVITPLMENSESSNDSLGNFKFSGNKIIIPYGNLGIKGLGDLHDTFDVDRFGNPYNGHTTFKSKFHINIDILKSLNDHIIK